MLEIGLKIAGATIAIFGILFTGWEIRANTLWRRKKHAADMILGWNEYTAIHREQIIKIIPHFPYSAQKGKSHHIDRTRAKEIYKCDNQESEEYCLHNHFIELLNYCEFVAVSYKKHIADRKMIAASAQITLILWHNALEQFIEMYKENTGRNPWKPFTDQVAEWKRSY